MTNGVLVALTACILCYFKMMMVLWTICRYDLQSNLERPFLFWTPQCRWNVVYFLGACTTNANTCSLMVFAYRIYVTFPISKQSNQIRSSMALSLQAFIASPWLIKWRLILFVKQPGWSKRWFRQATTRLKWWTKLYDSRGGTKTWAYGIKFCLNFSGKSGKKHHCELTTVIYSVKMTMFREPSNFQVVGVWADISLSLPFVMV